MKYFIIKDKEGQCTLLGEMEMEVSKEEYDNWKGDKRTEGAPAMQGISAEDGQREYELKELFWKYAQNDNVNDGSHYLKFWDFIKLMEEYRSVPAPIQGEGLKGTIQIQIRAAELNHLPDKSVYNHNFYKHPNLGYEILEICDEEHDYYSFYLVEGDNKIFLGDCQLGIPNDIELTFKEQFT